MEFFDWHNLMDAGLLRSGKLLIAQPFMQDGNFARSVVFLCEYSEEGSLGFVLNQPTSVNIGDLLPELHYPSLVVNHGGPVQLDTLHMLHRLPDAIGGIEVNNGVFWGGSFDALQLQGTVGTLDSSNIRLFVGYAGWSPGQLENELKEGSWLIGDISQEVVFDTPPEEVWKAAILSLGKEYKPLANMPVDPGLN